MILLMELRKRIEGATKLGIDDNGALIWVLMLIDEIIDEEINNMTREKDEHNKPGT